MDLRVKKGTKMSEVYYTFLFFKVEEEYEVLLEYYEQNRWWFNNMIPEARKECELTYAEIREKVGKRKTNKKSSEFFSEEYK